MHVFTFLIVSCTVLWQLYLTGAVYSLDGSDSLKETMQASIVPDNEVSYLHIPQAQTFIFALFSCTVQAVSHC